MVLAGDLVPAGTTLVTPAVTFLVWENTTRKELQPLELTRKLTTEFAYNGTSRGCIKNVIGELTIWLNRRFEMYIKDAIATKQNVTLWANWRSRPSRYKRIQLCRTDLHQGSSPIRIRQKSYFQGKFFPPPQYNAFPYAYVQNHFL